MFCILRVAVLCCGANIAAGIISRKLDVSRNVSSCASIPDFLHLNYKKRLLSMHNSTHADSALNARETLLRENLHNTLERMPGIQVATFLNNAECHALISEVWTPELASFFQKERRGAYKSDVCRLAQLYVYGGHYVDNDIELVADVRTLIPPCTGFASIVDKTGDVLQAYLAATPRHPLIRLALQNMAKAYRHELKWERHLGPYTLRLALEPSTLALVSGVSHGGDVFLFAEQPGQARSTIGWCNMEVLDPRSSKRVFFSRAAADEDWYKQKGVKRTYTVERCQDLLPVKMPDLLATERGSALEGWRSQARMKVSPIAAFGASDGTV